MTTALTSSSLLQGASWSSIPDVHADLLDDYMEGFEQLADVPDDGYIMQNAGHHLVGAKRLWDLKKLISSPTWLETKLHSYGVASVVADFRRWVPPASSWPLICCHGRTCKGLLGNPA